MSISLVARTPRTTARAHSEKGRFKSQPLLDEAGLLMAMAYVDLNPIRGGIAATPEESEFTSIYQRIREMRTSSEVGEGAEVAATVPLTPFRGQQINQPEIPYRLNAYLELVHWVGHLGSGLATKHL